VDANLEQHARLIEAAAREGVDVLVFPELSLTGYELDLARQLAFTESDPRLAPLVDLAARHGINLIVGAPIRVDSHLYLGAFILAPDRSIDFYTKHHLGAFSPADSADGIVPPPERSVFEPGERNPPVTFGGNMAAVAVCADTAHVSHADYAARRGANTYLASMFVIPSDLGKDMANLRGYASRHSMAVAFANYGGPSGGLPAAGRSAIWSQTGELLTQLDEAGTGVALASEDREGWRSKQTMLAMR
jgi:predicted amidohydrolase